MNTLLLERIAAARSIALFGHVRPDGDCVGSTLALYNYIRSTAPEKRVSICLEQPMAKFAYLEGFQNIVKDPAQGIHAELAIALDVSDHGRLGDFAALFDAAKRSLNIDHHVTNPHFAMETICEPERSSTCELLYTLLPEQEISREIAACLYTGIITDTGVFKYSQTSAETMRIAGVLMETGIPFGDMIDVAYYRKTFVQNRILGRALTKAVSVLDGRLIYAVITLEDKAEYGASSMDLDGIAEQLRLTEGVECSVLCGETEPGEFKLSMRSYEKVNVSEIAACFGGGGHIRAAGCTVRMPAEEIMRAVTEKIRGQLLC
ncbi:phosphoesterase RecJ-like protein [Fusobacterium naviforme]|nr:bifunctional oligoribonuclease/PAP phosphatase NrnA [Fusobacterium naviforme]PSL10643.1 phosphoesterase RecJ-like protein [Fusobacterium naviforme]STO27192.1 Bifunctional oligoribonuclease and PAP phosphatase nrnA [Fusobacterium naviforme]